MTWLPRTRSWAAKALKLRLQWVAVPVVAVLAGSSAALSSTVPKNRPALPGAPACPIFPSTNVWNRDISTLPAALNSSAMIAAIGLTSGLHPDFGSFAGYGIPYTVVAGSQKRQPVTFDFASESDKGPYPIPAHPLVEQGSDRHLLIVDKSACRLYELYAFKGARGRYHAGSGAIWDLRSNVLQPDGWTSADAAGLPILPGLVRYDEVAAGRIAHALRFTAPRTRNRHLYPARHDAGAANPGLPPMGLRLRLKASVDLSGFSVSDRVILAALKHYGLILADNGSPWYITGAPDPRWNDDDLHRLGHITGADFEVVDTRTLRNSRRPRTVCAWSAHHPGTFPPIGSVVTASASGECSG